MQRGVGEGQGCSSCFAACLGLCPFQSHFYRFLLRRRRRKRDEHFQLDAVPGLVGVAGRGERVCDGGEVKNSMADLKFKVSKKLVNNYWLFFPSQTL